MTRRLQVSWPDPRPFARHPAPIRILAASDEPDRSLDDERNRAALGHVDLIVGCGDLPPDRIGFLGDAFSAPVVCVRGNHDRGGAWRNPAHVPEPASGIDRTTLAPIPLLALPWPGREADAARRNDLEGWVQVMSAAAPWVVRPPGPSIIISHAPPLGANDNPADPYHRGFAAYGYLLDRLRPPLWLHGHAALAAASAWQCQHGPTTLVNVTGSVLVEIEPP